MSKLRLELCSECCFDCVFCHHDQVNMTDTENKKLDASDYGFLCKVGKLCGFNHVLLSGGEPLIRKDINDIMRNIKDSGVHLQVTSNGYLLGNVKDKTLIDSINISIHSLDLATNEKIINKKYALPKVIDNVYTLREKSPKTSIKINMVALKDKTIEVNNLRKMLDFSAENGITLKIIELLDETSAGFISVEDIAKILEGFGFSKTRKRLHKVFYSNGQVDVILQKCFCQYAKHERCSEVFCNKNNDLFVLSNGEVQLCRYGGGDRSLYDMIKARDTKNLLKALKECKLALGKNCIYDK